MLERYQRTYGHLLRVLDLLILVGAWLGSYWVRFDLPFEVPKFLAVTKGLPDFSTYAAMSPFIVALWGGGFSLSQLYETSPKFGRRRELLLLLKSHSLALLIFVALSFFFTHYQYSRLVIFYFATLSGAGVFALHLGLRTALRKLRPRGFSRRKVLVLGEEDGVERLIGHLDWYPELGLQIVGVVTRTASGAREVAEKPVLGQYCNVSEIIAQTGADEVLLALPPTGGDDTDRLLHVLKDETVDVRIAPDVLRYVTLGCEVEQLGGMPILRVNDSPVMGWRALFKRLTDIVVSATAILLLSPLMLIIALAVKLTSRGPILFTQERMGLDGGSFSMLKFRSMTVGAEARTGAVWAQKGDNRCTAIGALLRKTSLDELPQLWNVLRGDMSLVGPRPERPAFVSKFRSEIPHYMLRHKVRTGITGWAQVNGWRGNTSLERRIECDLFYIRNWSNLLDLKIIVMTLWKGFIHKNAY